MRLKALLACTILTAGCGGGGGGSNPQPAPPANAAPVITSAGAASVPENTGSDFYQASATDPNGNPITYTLSGPDAARFTISAAGAIRFVAAPDFEAPADVGQDNAYDVVLTASDGQLQSSINLRVTVTNVGDATTVAQAGGVYVNPTFIAPVPGSGSIFVAQQNGEIYIVNPATTDKGSLYLTVGNLLQPPSGAIGGLRAVTPAPDYATSGILYVLVLNSAGELELRRYGRLNPATGDPASADILLRIPRTQADSGFGTPAGEAFGGWIGFGPDGLLYLTTGTNVAERSSSLDSLLGKVLRIDIARDDFPADPNRDYGIPAANPFSGAATGREVYARGFRDPRDASFNGPDLLVGDSRGNEMSELNIVRPQDAGSDYGAGGLPPVLRTGLFQISFTSSITGGYVYRGSSPQLQGLYVFYAGMTGGGIKTIPAASLVQGTTRTPENFTHLRDEIATGFTEDASGNLYYISGNQVFVFRVS